MEGGAGEEVVVVKHLVKRGKANSLEAIEGVADKERKILELDSEGEDDMEPDESMTTRDNTHLEQVNTNLAELKWDEDEDDDDWEAIMAAQSRRMDELDAEERKREILAKLPLIPFQKYTYQYQYQHQEEEEEETEYTKEQMVLEEREFAVYRSSCESSCYGSFEHLTTLSPMYFTHWTPERIPLGIGTTVSSLQIYSFEIQMKGQNLNWPLYVYGVVAARDNVDRDRNLLFYRTRDNPQILTQDDQFLRLTGPSRAIFAFDPVDFEVQLKLKGRTKSRDKQLLNQHHHYCGRYTTGSTSIKFENCKCTAELSLDKYPETVQATILGVRIVEGSLFPFKYGGRVVCYSPPKERWPMGSEGTVHDVMDLSKEILLLDSRDFDGSEMPMCSDGYLDLSRRVVSVQLQKAINCSAEWEESLKVVIEAYSETLTNNKERKRRLGSKDIDANGHVKFRPKYCNISQGTCYLGSSKVEVTVAWSAIGTSKSLLSLRC